MSDLSPTPSSTRAPSLNGAVVAAALVLGLSFIASAFVLSWQKRQESFLVNQSLSVIGRATKFVTADTLKWSMNLEREGTSTSTEASILRELDQDVEFIKQKRSEAGATDITVSRQPHRFSKGYCYMDYHYPTGPSDAGMGMEIAPTSGPINEPTEVCSGGRAYQTIVIETKNAEKANAVTGSMAAWLNDRKVYANDLQTNFIVSDEESLRRELLDLAMRDAREKAEKLAPGRVGALTRTLDDQLSLTAKNQNTDYYYGGQDQSSVEKKAILTLPTTFILK